MAQQQATALVTGASSGLGFELAKVLADGGYALAVVAQDDKIHTAAKQLTSSKSPVIALQRDLRSPEAVEEVDKSLGPTEHPDSVKAAANQIIAKPRGRM